MPGRAKSNTKKLQDAREERDAVMRCAVLCYKQEQTKTDDSKKLGLRAVCKKVSDDYFVQTKRRVELDYSTLGRWVKGGKSLAESNAEKSWLFAEEADNIISYAVENANRGFPFSHRRLREHVNAICRARLSDKFPSGGVGFQWPYRFVERHSSQLTTYWSRPLDTARSRAVNPNTKELYFDLLEETVNHHNIPEELRYGVDETGILPGGGTTERVIGGRGKSVQHQQRSGDRENITVIPIICADGTAPTPVILFKGLAYQIKWLQDNPLKAL
jgi:hypothetical protein